MSSRRECIICPHSSCFPALHFLSLPSIFAAGYSADSDYHSEYGFPLQQQNCVDPNAPTSQFLQAAAPPPPPPDQAMVSPFNAQPQQQYFDPGGGGGVQLQQDFYNQQVRYENSLSLLDTQLSLAVTHDRLCRRYGEPLTKFCNSLFSSF